MEGARLNAVNVRVNNMKSMTNIFDIAGNSMATLERIIVQDNDLTTASPPLLWTGIDVRDNSMASVTDLIVRDSTNVRYLVAAQSYSMVNVQNSVANDLIGGRQVVSIFFANSMK